MFIERHLTLDVKLLQYNIG